MRKFVLVLISVLAMSLGATAQNCSTGAPRYRPVFCCDGSVTFGGGCSGLSGQCKIDFPGFLCSTDPNTGNQCYVGDASSCSLSRKKTMELAILDQNILRDLGKMQ